MLKPGVAMYVLIGRGVSLFVALGYVISLVIGSGQLNAGILCPCAYLLFPLGLIWFPEEAGSITGNLGQGGNIHMESPPILVSIIGWAFLFAPLLLSFVSRG